MTDHLTLVSSNKEEKKDPFYYDEEHAKKHAEEHPDGGSIYLGTVNVRDMLPEIYPDDSDSPETKERVKAAADKFWNPASHYITINVIILVTQVKDKVTLIYENPPTKERPYKPIKFKTLSSWNEVLERIKDEFHWTQEGESGLRMREVSVSDVDDPDKHTTKFQIHGVYPFSLPFMKEGRGTTRLYQVAIEEKIVCHLWDICHSMRYRKKLEDCDEDIIGKIKEAFKPKSE